MANDRRRSQQGSGAQGDVTVIHDADLEYNPDDLRRLLVPFLHEGVDAVFGSLSVGAFYISVTRWATSCSLGSATSTHVMSLSLLAKPAQACPGGGAGRHEPPKGRMDILFTTAFIASMLIFGST